VTLIDSGNNDYLLQVKPPVYRGQVFSGQADSDVVSDEVGTEIQRKSRLIGYDRPVLLIR
jgi:hypothetical protein